MLLGGLVDIDGAPAQPEVGADGGQHCCHSIAGTASRPRQQLDPHHG